MEQCWSDRAEVEAEAAVPCAKSEKQTRPAEKAVGMPYGARLFPIASRRGLSQASGGTLHFPGTAAACLYAFRCFFSPKLFFGADMTPLGAPRRQMRCAKDVPRRSVSE